MEMKGFLRSEEGLRTMRDYFHRNHSRIAAVLLGADALRETALAPRGAGVAFLIRGVASTCAGILRVGYHPCRVDESYMLGRALLERQVNLAFLCVCDRVHYDDYVLYAKQRTYRDMERSAGIGDLKVTMVRSPQPDPTEIPELQQALERFTNRKGRPKNWTSLTLDERVAVIAKRVPECVPVRFSLAQVGIYSVASEALHGTLFGVGAFAPDDFRFDPERGDFDWDHHAEQLCLLFMTLAHTADSVLQVLAHAGEHSLITALAEEASEEQRALRKFLE